MKEIERSDFILRLFYDETCFHFLKSLSRKKHETKVYIESVKHMQLALFKKCYGLYVTTTINIFLR